MKYLIPVLILFVIGGSLQAQEPMVDSTETTSEKKAFTGKRPHLDMLLVDLNWDWMLGVPGGVEQKWYGRGINVSLMYDYPFLKDGRISGAIGGAFTSHNYYTNALVQKAPGTELAQFTPVPGSVKDKGKISLNYVDIPLEIRLRTLENSKGYRWKLAVGGRVGYLINVHEKTIDGEGFKTKLYHYPHVSKWRYGTTLRFGYGAVMLTGFYSLSTLFQTGKAVDDINAISVGVTISPF